ALHIPSHSKQDFSTHLSRLISQSASAASKHLRKNKPARGITVSADGQLTLNKIAGTAKLLTNRTHAVSLERPSNNLTFGAITLETTSAAGLFAVSSLDMKPVEKSNRLLIIYATDARNTDMRFADAEERTIIDFGRRPTLLRHGKLTALLNTRLGGSGSRSKWRLQRLDLTGRVVDTITLSPSNQGLRFTLDNAPAGGVATTYWLLEQIAKN
ncbi:MAG: hypothetical protein AAGG72_01035, partial [Pseudomonadota bacterium]